MTALHVLSAALSLHDDPPSPPSDEFEFESEYVKSLLRERTPSPVVHKPATIGNTARDAGGKENLDRWRTPVTTGASTGRTVLGQRDLNSAFNRSTGAMGFTGDTNTPAVKLPFSQSTQTALGPSSTRYPRRGRLTRLGPPKRTSRLSSDSMDPSETDAPAEPQKHEAASQKEISILNTIPSSRTDEPKGLRGLIQLQHQQAVLNANGHYTPPASQEKIGCSHNRSQNEYVPNPNFPHEEPAPPIRDPSPKVSPLVHDEARRESSSSSSSESSKMSSTPKSLGQSSLRQLLTSTSPKPIDVALGEVQRGLEALCMRRTEQSSVASKSTSPGQEHLLKPSPLRKAFPTLQNEIADRKSPVQKDIAQEYVPQPGVAINILPTRRKSTSHPQRQDSPPAQKESHARISPSLGQIHIQSQSRAIPNADLHPPPKMHLDPDAKSPSKKGKAVILVNSRPYTRLCTIGRGGSSKVYKVISPQTNKIYALKKVSFDKADQSAIMGYKNEIRLLNRMAERENQGGFESRCIRLFDWESCDDKGFLLMLMECGEIDFAHILAKHQGVPLSLNFIRVYWEQMLRAVQAIHDEKIIHSDLKPANFLLVQGQLKLIDFGIAKRMGDDTTNIHRDQQIGTVNYMSPEAILDTNHNNPHIPPGSGRLMKLGKKSDVWSLGCILYQMIYGKTPFSDLTMYQKIQSIPDEKYPIKFPTEGTGGVRVDRGAERCVRMCLVRDQRKRWGIEELLNDRFLRGEVDDERLVGITREEIGSMIEQTLGFGRMNGGKMLSKETIENLAKDAFEKLRVTRLRE